MLRLYRVILREIVFSNLRSYTNISNAFKIFNMGLIQVLTIVDEISISLNL